MLSDLREPLRTIFVVPKVLRNLKIHDATVIQHGQVKIANITPDPQHSVISLPQQRNLYLLDTKSSVE
jgi:hypothetical protein